MSNYTIHPEILSSTISAREENYISQVVYESYNKFYDNFDKMDLEIEELLAKYYGETKRYAYSFYLNGKGASCGFQNSFLKLRYKDIIFKIFFY